MSAIQEFAVVMFLLSTVYHCLGQTNLTNGGNAPHQLIAQASNKFTIDMYSAMKEKDGNIFVSPFSVKVLLALLYLGSKGAVSNEIQTALHLPNNENTIKEGFKELIGRAENSESLEIATRMFGAAGFKIKYKFLADAWNYFYSGIDNLDFMTRSAEAVAFINSFVAEKTHNKITKLFDSLATNTVLVLVNALYFKADWKYTFPRSFRDKFFITRRNSVDAPMMYITGHFNYKHNIDLGAQILEIPYQGDEYSMFIILPDDIDGLRSVEHKIATTTFESITYGMEEEEVNLQLPKFKMEETIQLNGILQTLGMTTMFVPGAANLTGIAEGPLYVSKAIQKTYINVDEKGTEAAAATGITVELLIAGGGNREIYFTANHPFLFVIVKKTENTVLFMGRLAWTN